MGANKVQVGGPNGQLYVYTNTDSPFAGKECVLSCHGARTLLDREFRLPASLSAKFSSFA
jgi:hypothetical protein